MAPDAPTIQEGIAELKKREEEATPRPWIVDTRGSLVLCSILQVPHDIMEESVVDFVNRESDADLIVAMRNQLPELLAYVAKLESDLAIHPNGRCGCAGEGRCQWCKLNRFQELASAAWRVFPKGSLRDDMREAAGE